MQVALRLVSDDLYIAFAIDADLADLCWPAMAAPAFRDELWRHSCVELFAAGPAASYREFNFSPSREFAAYDFDICRGAMRAVSLDEAPTVSWRAQAHRITLDVQLPVRWLPHCEAPSRALALAAVIEQRDGSLSYWALRHPGPLPDFHHRDGFIAGLPAASV